MLIAVKLSKNKKKPKNIIALVGERFAGKTQLFININ
jgi:ABC-type phosphate/phosphonate transport system ATPase subunit